jgi:hypothetical protein
VQFCLIEKIDAKPVSTETAQKERGHHQAHCSPTKLKIVAHGDANISGPPIFSGHDLVRNYASTVSRLDLVHPSGRYLLLEYGGHDPCVLAAREIQFKGENVSTLPHRVHVSEPAMDAADHRLLDRWSVQQLHQSRRRMLHCDAAAAAATTVPWQRL